MTPVMNKRTLIASDAETLLPPVLRSRVLLPKGPRVGEGSTGRWVASGMIPSARKPNEPVEVVSMRARSRSGGLVWETIEPMIPCWLRRIRWDVIVGGSRTGCAFGGSWCGW